MSQATVERPGRGAWMKSFTEGSGETPVCIYQDLNTKRFVITNPNSDGDTIVVQDEVLQRWRETMAQYDNMEKEINEALDAISRDGEIEAGMLFDQEAHYPDDTPDTEYDPETDPNNVVMLTALELGIDTFSFQGRDEDWESPPLLLQHVDPFVAQRYQCFPIELKPFTEPLPELTLAVAPQKDMTQILGALRYIMHNYRLTFVIAEDYEISAMIAKHYSAPKTGTVVKFKMTEGCDDLIPKKAHHDDAAWDLRSREEVWIAAGEVKIIPTGLFIELPTGYEAQIRPRSGMSFKTTSQIANSPGTIDCQYRGEVGVIMRNLTQPGAKNLHFERGDRIAQMIIQKLPDIELEQVTELSNTQRGSGGFGSTGIR